MEINAYETTFVLTLVLVAVGLGLDTLCRVDPHTSPHTASAHYRGGGSQAKHPHGVLGPNKDIEAFRWLQVRYLLIWALAVFGDWLQGPYVYKVYHRHGYDRIEIQSLFVTGCLSAAILGAPAAGLADFVGRKKVVMAYFMTYAASCFTYHFQNMWILVLGRILSGISQSLQYSVFESWLVRRHNTEGFPSEWIRDTFKKASMVTGIVAILAGLLAQMMVTNTSAFDVGVVSFGEEVAVFELAAAVLLFGFACTWWFWEEEGDAAPMQRHNTSLNADDIDDDDLDEDMTLESKRSYLNENPGRCRLSICSKLAVAARGLYTACSQNKAAAMQIICIGTIQSFFEGALVVFSILWTPAMLQATTATTTSSSSSSSSLSLSSRSQGGVGGNRVGMMATSFLSPSKSSSFHHHHYHQGGLWQHNYHPHTGPTTTTSLSEYSQQQPFLAPSSLLSSSLSSSTSSQSSSSSSSSSPDSEALPLGLIFASLMASLMVGGLVFEALGTLCRMRVNSSLVFALLIAEASFIVSLVALQWHSEEALAPLTLLLAFCIYEMSVGLYMPCIASVKAAVVPEKARSRIYGAFRVPLNIITVSVLCLSWPIWAMFSACAALVAGSLGAQFLQIYLSDRRSQEQQRDTVSLSSSSLHRDASTSSDYLLSRWARANYGHGNKAAYGTIPGPPSKDGQGGGDEKTTQKKRQNSTISVGSIAEDGSTALAAAE